MNYAIPILIFLNFSRKDIIRLTGARPANVDHAFKVYGEQNITEKVQNILKVSKIPNAS